MRIAIAPPSPADSTHSLKTPKRLSSAPDSFTLTNSNHNNPQFGIKKRWLLAPLAIFLWGTQQCNINTRTNSNGIKTHVLGWQWDLKKGNFEKRLLELRPGLKTSESFDRKTQKRYIKQARRFIKADQNGIPLDSVKAVKGLGDYGRNTVLETLIDPNCDCVDLHADSKVLEVSGWTTPSKKAVPNKANKPIELGHFPVDIPPKVVTFNEQIFRDSLKTTMPNLKDTRLINKYVKTARLIKKSPELRADFEDNGVTQAKIDDAFNQKLLKAGTNKTRVNTALKVLKKTKQ